jgi:modulator of FtsH protease HflK
VRRIIFVLFGVLFIAYLLTGVTQVRPGERAVIRRFGRVLDDKPGPGLWVGLPWGMDRVDRVSVDSVRRVVVGYRPEGEETEGSAPAGQLLTGDHNLVNVTVVLDCSVRESEVADFVVQEDRADLLVTRAAEAVLAEWVAGRTVEEVLLQGKASLPAAVVVGTQERLEPYRLGIEVRQANVAYLFPPDEVRSAFDDVARAQAAIRTRTNQAEQDAERRLRESRSEAFRIEQLSAAYASEQRLRARAEAKSFEDRLALYHKLRGDNPDYLRGIWLNQLSRLFARMKEGGQLDLLDNHLSADGLDLTIIQPPPKKK